MRILLLHNYYQQRGGEDAVFESEAALLAQKGHAVETLVFRNSEINGFSDRLKAGINSLYSQNAARLFREKICSFQPDVIHVHNFFPLASPSIFTEARRYGIPTVMTVHNFRLICPGALLYRQGSVCESCVNKTLPWEGVLHACYRNSRLQSASVAMMSAFHKMSATWRNIDRFICLTQFAKERLLNSSLGLDPTNISIKPNFSFDPFVENSQKAPEQRSGFLYAGRLSEEKGIATLLEAFRGSDLQLKVAGTGPLSRLVEEAARENSNITYLGFQEHPAVLELLKSARALILPSVWYENFPMIIVEALSAGTPVIASRMGGLPDIVEEGKNGFLFHAGDSQDLRKKLNEMTEPEAFRLGVQARRNYEEKYAPDINYQALIQIYESVVRKN